MKKLLSLVLAALMLLSFAACSGSNGNGGQTANGTQKPTEAKEYRIGQTVKTDKIEFTLTKIDYTNYIGTNGSGNDVASGNVCLSAYYTVKNIGKTKMTFSTMFGVRNADVVVDYDDGYTFESVGSRIKEGSVYAYHSQDILPLSDAKEIVTFFEAPKAIQEETRKSLHINVTLTYEDGTQEVFVYVIR